MKRIIISFGLMILFGYAVFLLTMFCFDLANDFDFSFKKPSDYFALNRVKNGDTYRNYMKCKGQCGTCKYHEGYLNRDKVLCKLSDKQMSERDTCDYYKMHRCFKKYEEKM